jgi:iron complex outermembrane receptor protein
MRPVTRRLGTGLSVSPFLAALLSSSGPCAAAAPAPPRASAESDAPSSASEVVVTATRRDTRLEETPVAITAITGAAIDRRHVESFDNIAITTPSLTFTALSRQESYPSIRGTTTGNDAPGSDLGVS